MPFCSERKKRTSSRDGLQFLDGFSRKLQFHLTFNRNFQIFLQNGKCPRTPNMLQHFTTWWLNRCSIHNVTICYVEILSSFARDLNRLTPVLPTCAAYLFCPPVPPVTSIGLCTTSDVITSDQNWHCPYSSSAAGKYLSNDTQIRVIGSIEIA